MSLLPCDACHERKPEKYANATWAWWNAAQERVAWRQKLCLQCYVQNVAVLETSVSTDPYDCPVCHSDPGEAMDPTYLTVYVPGLGPRQLEMATCAVCAVEVRVRGQEGARKLPDRLKESRGQDPGPLTDSPAGAWAALGITPRE